MPQNGNNLLIFLRKKYWEKMKKGLDIVCNTQYTKDTQQSEVYNI